MIRKIEEESKASVVIMDGTAGEVCVSAKNQIDLDKAKKMILDLVKEVEVGEVYNGKVVKIMAFGAFIELLPGKEGLLHVSKISSQRVSKVDDYLHVGQALEVKVAEIDNQHRINLELLTLIKDKRS
jgi:polyribonucleotide nucleotidyltransferase